MKPHSALGCLLPVMAGILASCLGCTTSPAQLQPPVQDLAMVSVCFTGNASPNWAGLDFKLLGLTLTPQAGTETVAVLTPPPGGLPFNLARLDHVAAFLGNAFVPAGAYTGATLTLATAPGDVEMDVASVPDPGFKGVGDGYGTFGSSQIHFQGAQTGNVLSLTIPFTAPLRATSGSQALLDLDWDSARPTFLTGAALPGNDRMLWTIAFDQVVAQRPVLDPTQLALLPVSGAVYAVAPDRQSFLLAPSFTAGILGGNVVSPQLLTLRLDPVNGTRFTDILDGSSQVIRDLATVGDALPGRMVRAGGRLQADGSLQVSRLWAGTAFEFGTEQGGRITRADPATGMVSMDGEVSTGNGFDTGASGLVGDVTVITALGAAPIAPGAGFVAGGMVARGFQVQSVLQWAQYSTQTTLFTGLDLEAANYHGAVVSADEHGLACACPTGLAGGVLQVALPYVAEGTPSGNDDAGNPVSGFSWWVFNGAAQRQSGPGAMDAFASAAGATVAFGGTVGVLQAQATLHALWGDPANPGGWSAQWAVLEALPLPQGTAATGWTPVGSGGAFGLALPGGVNPVTVDVLGAGTPTEVYVVTGPGPASMFATFPVLTPVDPATPAGQARLASLLVPGAPVQVFGVPAGTGHLRAGIVFCYVYTN